MIPAPAPTPAADTRELPLTLRRIRGALGMGLLWGVTWGLGGLAIGISSVLTPFLPWDAFFRVFDAPLPALAMPGFIAGLLFSGVLRVAAKRRPLAELSTRQFALWGAIGGLLVAMLPDLLLALGLGSVSESAPPLWQLTAIIATPMVTLGSFTSALSFQLAKRIPDPIRIDGHEEMLALVEELTRPQ